ncbi:MAG TPA: bifunctional 5,10-methylenetetrahydrofolate dehydrogenase/5,10-methenyltetrahydrofolate cyclohydrolase [Candidatus Avilachnospira avistercoris]|nr:bifunctional 5,10-methylenetetrahydrofolate dehydrogenase/5,10-methenyltetrahydrofolate cyclohydrolase [Candidatus Avilachnospira avistercoris]
MKELKGKAVSDAIKEDIKKKLPAVETMLGRKPKLVIVRCGERPEDLAYERNAIRRIRETGMEAESCVFPEDISDNVFLRAFGELNSDKRVDGILLMRPLPKQLNEGFIISCIDSEKDLDGVSPVNAAGLFLGIDGFAPCTAQAVMELLSFYKIGLEGKNVVVIGRSNVVGKPLSMMLLRENATVTICHSRTKDLEKITKKADILITAIGRPRFITSDHIKRSAVVIDVGINTDKDGKLCGDVDYEDCKLKASAITPVPGGVGAVTTAVLAKHLLLAANRDLL